MIDFVYRDPRLALNRAVEWIVACVAQGGRQARGGVVECGFVLTADDEIRAAFAFAPKGVTADLDAGLFAFDGDQYVGDLTFGDPCADGTVEYRQAAFKRAVEAGKHALGDFRDTGHHQDVFDAYARRA